MKRIAIAVLALALAPLASAQLYKWVDKDGKVHYSDQPPPASATKQINVAPGPAAPPPSALEKDKALEKTRAQSRDAAKKAEDAEKLARQRQEACEKARSYLKGIENGGRFTTFDAKGDRVYMEQDQIDAETAKARKNVEESCKST
jgi:coenzyme F420-reducing hydrogenase alpha subunit